MKLIFIWVLFCIISCNQAHEMQEAQALEKRPFVVEGRVHGILGDKVRLMGFYGHQTMIIDTAFVDSTGRFKFHIDEDLPRGMYRILLGKGIRAQFLGGGEQFVDLLFKYEDIIFQTHFEFPFDSMQVIQSAENEAFYKYLLLKDDVQKKLEVLQQGIQHYPRTDDFYRVMASQYREIFDAYKSFIDGIHKQFPGSLLATIVNFDRIPYVDPLLEQEQRNEQLKKTFFNEQDFRDTLLLYTDMIPAKVIRYLSLYRNDRQGQEVQEALYIQAVDVILSYAAVEEDIFNNVLNYLLEGFEQFGMETTLLHLYDNYVLGNACFDDERMASLKDKTEAIRRMGIGQPAPDFSIVDMKGQNVQLSAIEAELTLVAFWATWCGHCTELMPEVYNLYRATDRNNFEVVAIALEDDKTDLTDYLAHYEMDWINYSSFKRWECSIARKFYVFATPTFFLLDEEKNILSKPMSIRDLRSFVY